ncbi:MAG: molybdopterin molybdotransferase MoeA [Clostridium sp.]|uniref:molybdopterin molybdotransferase MoeA n=1 Tax=Clostridium sp. TaxID=1506 RepID=UPI003EE7476B
MISLEDARKIILENIKEKDFEEVTLFETLGRTLFEDVYSPINNPPFPKSPLDGYAIRGEELEGLEGYKEFKVVDKIFAGEVSVKEVKIGECIRIMTGAKIPEVLNCIVRQEDTEEKNGIVKIFKAHKPYDNYIYRGEDFKKGDKILEKGKKITSSEMMALAALGLKSIKVYKKATVGLINTGDEIQNPGEELKDGKVFNCNGAFLISRIKELNLDGILYNNLLDNEESLRNGIRELEEKTDIIISTGGVSVGEKDIVQKVVHDLGYEILFWKVDIKPGSPLFVGKKGEKLYIGLSGTPVASATTFELLCRDAILKMIGSKEDMLKYEKAILKDNFEKKGKKRRFLRAYKDNEGFVSINNVYQSPGQVHTMINSNCILEVKPGEVLKSGEEVYIIR